jgi:hypothetical protein
MKSSLPFPVLIPINIWSRSSVIQVVLPKLKRQYMYYIYHGSYELTYLNKALRRKCKDWLAWNRDNVSEWGNESIRELLFQ